MSGIVSAGPEPSSAEEGESVTRSRETRAYKLAMLSFGVPVLVGLGVYWTLLVNEKSGIGVTVLWITSLPAIIFVFVSLISLGAAATYKPLVNRDSLLWSWLNFMGRGSAGVLLLVSGSLVGALLGALVSTPSGDLTPLFIFAASIVSIWLAMIVLIWTIRAVIDVGRIGSEREAVIRAWLIHRRATRTELKTALLTLGSERTSVIAAGFVMLVLIGAMFLGMGVLFGFWPDR